MLLTELVPPRMRLPESRRSVAGEGLGCRVDGETLLNVARPAVVEWPLAVSTDV